MDKEEFRRMGELEDSMWWYRGLHANVLHAIRTHAPGSTDLLDAGCGTGGVLKAIRKAHPNMHLNGLDLSEMACAIAREKSGATVTTGSVDRLEYADGSFDVLLSLDVLGYELDRDAVIKGYHRVLRPGGRMILNLPAYQWMLSYHDRAVGQGKRFTLAEGVELVQRHGFQVRAATYWNTILFPLMFIRRKLLPGSSSSDVKPFGPIMNTTFERCLALERQLTDRQVRLPFGGSIFLIAERPAS